MTKPPDTDQTWPWVRYFLEYYLPVHRGGRANTLASYRTTFRLLRRYLSIKMGEGKTRELPLEALEPSLILDFLGWLQSPEGRRVGASTRNVRLAALRSFFRCLEVYCSAAERSRWERLRHLPDKRTAKPSTDHLETHELNQIFAQVNLTKPEGLRDLTLLAVLYNTGARASEVAGMHNNDLTFDDFASVRIHGKGGRERRCPLWPSTVALLKRHLGERLNGRSEAVFVNQRGGPLTRHGIGRRITHYIALASPSTPSLASKNLTTHSFRHTTAIHLLESGADMHAIKAWLGHGSTRSTDHYLDLDLRKQRELLSRFSQPLVLQQFVDRPKNDAEWLDSL